MKRHTHLNVYRCAFLVGIVQCATALTIAGDAAREDVNDVHTPIVQPAVVPAHVLHPSEVDTASPVVLYDNGPLITGIGTDDVQVSELETGLGMSTLGFAHKAALGYSIADDFEVPAGQVWLVQSLKFFAYQTGSGPESTITSLHARILADVPSNQCAPVVWGDLESNRLAATGFSSIYRTSGIHPNERIRPIMDLVARPNAFIHAGTYWCEWQTGGTLGSGPWAPPITIVGQTTTGNGLQYITAWQPASDSGTLAQQGFPFIIAGHSLTASGERLLRIGKLRYLIKRTKANRDKIKFIAFLRLANADLPLQIGPAATLSLGIAGVSFLAGATPRKVAGNGQSARFALPDPKQGKVKVTVLNKNGLKGLVFRVNLKRLSGLDGILGVSNTDARRRNSMSLKGTDVLVELNTYWGMSAVDSLYWGKHNVWTKGAQPDFP